MDDREREGEGKRESENVYIRCDCASGIDV